MTHRRQALTAVGAVVVLFLLVPIGAALSGDPSILTLAGRIIVLAIAATGVNLLLGSAGLVSLGHGLYLGIGVYSVGILSAQGMHSGLLQLALGLAVGAVASSVVGFICLRTRGIGFIMSTLAFAQMGYYIAIGLRKYGGDDGMNLPQRSVLPGVDIQGSDVTLYLLMLGTLAAVLLLKASIKAAPFGLVLDGIRLNEERTSALGYRVMKYKLTAYVMSALVCVLAGFYYVNLYRYVSPSAMTWVISGELIVMIVIGGMFSLSGPVVGAVLLVCMEEVLANFHLGLPFGIDAVISSRWMSLLGLFIIAASCSRDGIAGMISRWSIPSVLSPRSRT